MPSAPSTGSGTPRGSAVRDDRDKEDGALLAARAGETVRVVLSAPLTRGAEAANVVGELPGRQRGAPHDRRRPPRRLVRRRLRRRDRGRGHARARPRLHRGGDPAAAHDRLRLAHRGGVRDRRVRLRLVLRRLVPGRRGAPRVVDRLALLPQRRGLRPPGAVHARRAARARGLGSPCLPAGEPRRPAAPRLPPRAAEHVDRGVAVPRRRDPGNQRLDVHHRVRPHRVPHAVRHDREGRLRVPGSADRGLRKAPARRAGLDFAARARDLRRCWAATCADVEALDAAKSVHRRRPRAARPRRDRRPALSARADGSRRRAARGSARGPAQRGGSHWPSVGIQLALLGSTPTRPSGASGRRRGRTAPRASWGGQGDADPGPDLWREARGAAR